MDSLAEGATEEETAQAIESWRDKARQAWGTWYLDVRPYDQRGDEFEAKLKGRLAGG